MAFKIAAKDFKLFFTDRAAIVLTFIVPIVMILVFGFAFGGMGGGSSIPKVRLPVADLDKSPQSAKLLSALSEVGSVTLLTEDSQGSAFTKVSVRQAVRDGDRYAALVIPKGFGSSVERGSQPLTELYHDPSQEVASSLVSGALQQAAARALGEELARAAAARGIKQMQLSPFQEQMALEVAASVVAPGGGAAPGPLIRIDAEAESAKQTEDWPAHAHSVAGITIMFLLFSVAHGGRSILEERDSGTLRRLLVSPSPKRNILLGKGLFLLALGVFQVSLMFLIGRLVFGLRVEQHLPPVAVMIFLTAAACTSFGLLLASACTSTKQVDGLSTLIILGMSAVGGSMFPRFIMPDWMQTAGLFTINAWAMDAFYGIFWHDHGLLQIAKHAAVLFGVALAMTAISVRLFNTRVTRGV